MQEKRELSCSFLVRGGAIDECLYFGTTLPIWPETWVKDPRWPGSHILSARSMTSDEAGQRSLLNLRPNSWREIGCDTFDTHRPASNYTHCLSILLVSPVRLARQHRSARSAQDSLEPGTMLYLGLFRVLAASLPLFVTKPETPLDNSILQKTYDRSTRDKSCDRRWNHSTQ